MSEQARDLALLLRASQTPPETTVSTKDSARDYCKYNVYALAEFAACVENVKLCRVRLDHDEALETCSQYVCR